MAGFINKSFTNISDGYTKILAPLKKLIRAGQDYEDLIINNKIGMGPVETSVLRSGGYNESDIYLASTYDINSSKNKSIVFFQKDYSSQRSFMRNMAKQRDISKFLDIITDEAICYDSEQYFCQPNHSILDDLEEDKKEEVLESIQEAFEHVYSNVLGFKDGKSAWTEFRQWLIDGSLAYELVYDNKGKTLLKAIQLDTAQLTPHVEFLDGKLTRGWMLNPGDNKLMRFLPDTHVVYVSYSKGNPESTEVSYVQQLIRSYNVHRTMENVATIWTILNSSFRMKTVVPTAGGRGKQEQMVGTILAKFREDVDIDENSGEVKIDGQTGLNLFRNYVLSSKNGQQTEIESIRHEGYDLSNPEIMKYWRDKLHEDSSIPYARLQNDGSSTWTPYSDQFERQEISFEKFIRRLRANWQEVILKPLFYQVVLTNEDLDSQYFKNKLGISFNQEGKYELYQKREAIKRDLEHINLMREFRDENDKPYFDLNLLIEEFGQSLGHDLLSENKKRMEEKAKNEPEEGEGEDSEDEFGLDSEGGDEEGGLDLGLDLGGEGEDPGSDDSGIDDIGDLNLDI